MTEHQIAGFRRRLLDERRTLLDERASYTAEDVATTDAGEDDLTDRGDEGSDLNDRDRSHAAEENFDSILAKIDRALAKIEDGTYGLSDIDGTPIPIERLEALPYALTTVEQEESL